MAALGGNIRIRYLAGLFVSLPVGLDAQIAAQDFEQPGDDLVETPACTGSR